MVKRQTVLLLLCFISFGLFAQEKPDSTFVRKGLIRSFGCFAFDYRPKQAAWDYRLHGFIEYFPEKRISLIAEYYHYLDSDAEFPVISKNFSVGTGLAYHWPKAKLDPYVFLLSIGNFYQAQVKTDSTVIKDEISTDGSPGMALGVGLNLYVWKYLNFFVQLRYHRTFIYSPIVITNMNSLSVSYGLGFNFHTKKKKLPE